MAVESALGGDAADSVDSWPGPGMAIHDCLWKWQLQEREDAEIFSYTNKLHTPAAIPTPHPAGSPLLLTAPAAIN